MAISTGEGTADTGSAGEGAQAAGAPPLVPLKAAERIRELQNHPAYLDRQRPQRGDVKEQMRALLLLGSALAGFGLLRRRRSKRGMQASELVH
jgi:hypothetical protein